MEATLYTYDYIKSFGSLQMTDSEWSRTLPQRPTVTHTQSKHLAGNLSI